MALRVVVAAAVRSPVGARFVRSAIVACAEVGEVAARVPEGEVAVAVRLTGDRQLRRLNREFLGLDEVTDVLAFPSGAAPALGADEAGHLGDIAVSIPAAARQAQEFGHPVEAEVALLCVHGFLHLLGWDHASAPEESEMNRLAVIALDRVGVEVSERRL